MHALKYVFFSISTPFHVCMSGGHLEKIFPSVMRQNVNYPSFSLFQILSYFKKENIATLFKKKIFWS